MGFTPTIIVIMIGISIMKNKDNLLVFVSTILVYAAGLSLVEDFTYPGFLGKHTSYLLLSIPAALVIFFVIKLIHKTRFYSSAVLLGTAGLLFIYFVANAVEDFTYANYIFSHLHFNPQFLLLAVIANPKINNRTIYKINMVIF